MKIFTIGFTKKSAETFFTRLKSAGVKRLVDVRLNNGSKKRFPATSSTEDAFCAARKSLTSLLQSIPGTTGVVLRSSIFLNEAVPTESPKITAIISFLFA